jgi:SAM-dependent methyltransferase
VRESDALAADPHGRGNYAQGSANLEARASIWSYRHLSDGEQAPPIDWFCDLVDWDSVDVAADIGAGSGRFLPSLARRAAHVIGLDLSRAMLDEIAAAGDTATLVGGDVCDLPLRDGCLDRALAAWMLYHAADPDQACAELRRVLRPGGVLIAVTNASAHCAELDQIYYEATERVLGSGRARPHLPTNGFTLDAAAAHLGRHFGSVTIHVRRVRMRLPTPEPVIAYLSSVRSYIDSALSADGLSFDDLVPHIAASAARRIENGGAVEVTGLPAAIICQ